MQAWRMAIKLWLILAIVVQSGCVENTVSIKNDEDLEVNIGEKQFRNPCKDAKCPSGKECTIQYTPRLLKIPIAHCVKSALKNDTCTELTIGTNILHCKSEAEWKCVGSLQCHLRNLQGANLTNIKVKHPCPDVRKTGERAFLAASFQCCNEDTPSTPTSIASTNHILKDKKIHVRSNADPEVRSQNNNIKNVYITSFGVALILILVLTTIGIWRYKCHHQRRQRPSEVPMKSLINPEVDEGFDCDDNSVLIATTQK